MKKTLYGLLLGLMTLGGVLSFTPAFAQNVSSNDWANPSNNKSMLDNKEATGSKLLDGVKTTINWILGMLATIALIVCLRGGFQMVTAAGDEKKFGTGKTILKQAAIGVAIILLAWMIVGVVFWFVTAVGGAEPVGQGAANG